MITLAVVPEGVTARPHGGRCRRSGARTEARLSTLRRSNCRARKTDLPRKRLARREAYYNSPMATSTERQYEVNSNAENTATKAIEATKKAYRWIRSRQRVFLIGERLAEMYWKGAGIHDAVAEMRREYSNAHGTTCKRGAAGRIIWEPGDVSAGNGQPRNGEKRHRAIPRDNRPRSLDPESARGWARFTA